jgi:regulator of protease activity HflC (stomatin/prohibitin superfamily)
MGLSPLLVAGLLVAFFAVVTVVRAVRIVPQARARNVERLGRYHRTLQPGLSFVIPYADRVHPAIDLREQVVSFVPQPVITEDNLVVEIDTVLYFQVTDPRSAAYEIASYLHAVEQLTVTTLRNVVGSMDLERTLTSRDSINSQLRSVLDEATGKWGLRVNRVEIKAIDPPMSIKDAMEKQMRAERDKRAAILSAEGQRQSQILTAEGDKQGAILRAEGAHRGDPDGRGQVPGDRRGVPGRAPQRPGPQAARLPVPAGAPAARPGPWQHVLGDPQRGHRGAEQRVACVHQRPAHGRRHDERGRPGRRARGDGGCRCREGRRGRRCGGRRRRGRRSRTPGRRRRTGIRPAGGRAAAGRLHHRTAAPARLSRAPRPGGRWPA